ncbi:MAG TPA: hypothetical protein VMT20_07865 [Terriglobia bacterium]|nr:hypothetical protein [Terriglobia bacterium]
MDRPQIGTIRCADRSRFASAAKSKVADRLQSAGILQQNSWLKQFVVNWLLKSARGKPLVRGGTMKRTLAVLVLLGVASIALAKTSRPQDEPQGAKQDMKDAGHDTEKAAKKTGNAVEKSSKKAAYASEGAAKKTGSTVEKSSKKAAHESKDAAKKTGNAVEKGTKTAGHASEGAAKKTGNTLEKGGKKTAHGLKKGTEKVAGKAEP